MRPNRKPLVRIKDEDIPKILELRRQGTYSRVIAQMFNVSPASINRLCVMSGIRPKMLRGHAFFWIKERKEELQFLWNNGDSIADIASHFGKSEAAISSQLSVMKKEGFDVKLRSHGARYVVKAGVYYKRGC